MAHSNLILFSCMSTMSPIVWIITSLPYILSTCRRVFVFSYALPNAIKVPMCPSMVPLFPSKGSRVPLQRFPDRLWSGVWVPCVAVVAVTSPASPAQPSPVQPPPDWFYIQPSPAHPGWSPINDINIHHLSRYSANTWPRSLAGHVATWDVVYQIAGRVCALYPPTINHPH